MRRGVVKGVLVALIVLCTTTPADALCLQSWEKKIRIFRDRMQGEP